MTSRHIRNAEQRTERDRAQWPDYEKVRFRSKIESLGELVTEPYYFGRAFSSPPEFTFSVARSDTFDELTKYPQLTSKPHEGVENPFVPGGTGETSDTWGAGYHDNIPTDDRRSHGLWEYQSLVDGSFEINGMYPRSGGFPSIEEWLLWGVNSYKSVANGDAFLNTTFWDSGRQLFQKDMGRRWEERYEYDDGTYGGPGTHAGVTLDQFYGYPLFFSNAWIQHGSGNLEPTFTQTYSTSTLWSFDVVDGAVWMQFNSEAVQFDLQTGTVLDTVDTSSGGTVAVDIAYDGTYIWRSVSFSSSLIDRFEVSTGTRTSWNGPVSPIQPPIGNAICEYTTDTDYLLFAVSDGYIYRIPKSNPNTWTDRMEVGTILGEPRTSTTAYPRSLGMDDSGTIYFFTSTDLYTGTWNTGTTVAASFTREGAHVYGDKGYRGSEDGGKLYVGSQMFGGNYPNANYDQIYRQYLGDRGWHLSQERVAPVDIGRAGEYSAKCVFRGSSPWVQPIGTRNLVVHWAANSPIRDASDEDRWKFLRIELFNFNPTFDEIDPSEPHQWVMDTTSVEGQRFRAWVYSDKPVTPELEWALTTVDPGQHRFNTHTDPPAEIWYEETLSGDKVSAGAWTLIEFDMVPPENIWPNTSQEGDTLVSEWYPTWTSPVQTGLYAGLAMRLRFVGDDQTETTVWMDNCVSHPLVRNTGPSPAMTIGVAEWITDEQGMYIGAKLWVSAGDVA